MNKKYSTRFLVETAIRLCREHKDKSWEELGKMVEAICQRRLNES